jgi:hypothetical protein
MTGLREIFTGSGARTPVRMIITLGWWVLCPLGALGQTVPTDLLDLSIDELFDANIVTEADQVERSRKWHVSYTYAVSDYDEYYIGSSSVTYEDVLFRPGVDARTENNYPVVPTEITQEVHAIRVGYDLSPATTVRVQLPFVMQSTDHISIVPGYDAFNISSEGIGDMAIVADITLSQSLNSIWKAGAGLSVPTGSIDDEGDTPRAPGNQQLPYTMQLGSGTWDFPLFLSFRKYEARWDWGMDASYTLRTGSNDRDYRLGNKASVGGWLMWKASSAFKPGVRLDYRWRDDIDGEDASVRVPIPGFPYPAPVTNPNTFGGEQLDLTLFARLPFAEGWYVEAAYSQPLYLDLHGPQSSEKFHFSLEIGTSF